MDTEGEGDEEQLVRVYKVKKMGRPSIGWEKDTTVSEENILAHPRRLNVQGEESLPEICSSTPSLSSKAAPKKIPGTSSRKKHFLLENTDSTIKIAKLPKSRTVLSNFLLQLEDKDLDKVGAAQETLKNVKEVWKHNFGMRVILGFDSDLQEKTKKMIIEDQYACTKIISIWKQLMELERTSRRPDRATKASFLKKVENIESEVLDMPFNLARQDFEMILKNDSGITDWKEDAQHLQNQLQRDQVGPCV